MDDEKKQIEIPWLDTLRKTDQDEKTEEEKIDFITTLMELEFR